LKKHPDGLRRSAHDIVDQIVKSNGHTRLRSATNGKAAVHTALCPGASFAAVPGALMR
jgi:hypothetical protein